MDELFAVGAGVIIFSLLICVFFIACYWVMFTKANRPGWAAIVPIYNTVVLFQTAKMNPWLILLYLCGIIPIVGPIVILVLNIILMLNLAKAFGRGTGFAIGLIFLPIIFIPILAFGDSKYVE